MQTCNPPLKVYMQSFNLPLKVYMQSFNLPLKVYMQSFRQTFNQIESLTANFQPKFQGIMHEPEDLWQEVHEFWMVEP